MDRTGRVVLRDIIRMQWDDGDLQGSVLRPFFDVAWTLTHLGAPVPDECEYHPSPAVGAYEDPDDEWPRAELVEAWYSDEISTADLQYWARVLARYFDSIVPEDRKY